MATSYFQDPFGAADYSAEGMPSLLSLSNLESLGRGSIAGLLGLPEDLRKMLVTKKMQENMDFLSSQSGIPQVPYFLPSSEELKQRTPRMTAPTPQAGLLEDIGAFMSPVPAAAVVPLARGGKAVARMAGQEITDVMSGMPSRSLLGDITPQGKLLDVYHGSPYTFPPTERNPLGEFDASKIGTGEGAQSFGYGIYTAEAPAVAKDYQFMQQNWFDTSKAKYKGKSINSWYEQAQKDQERAFRTKDKSLEQDATARLAYWENIMTHNHPENVLKQFTDPEYGWDAATNYAKSIDLSKFKGVPSPGNLYKVDLPDEKIATMLDWDKPMAEQRNLIEKIRKALVGGDSPLSRVRQFEINDFLNDNVRLRNLRPQSIVNLNDPQIVKRLSEAGIPGIKYLDQFSREAGQGTRNFVTFPGSEKSMTILERNGMTGLLD